MIKPEKIEVELYQYRKLQLHKNVSVYVWLVLVFPLLQHPLWRRIHNIGPYLRQTSEKSVTILGAEG